MAERNSKDEGLSRRAMIGLAGAAAGAALVGGVPLPSLAAPAADPALPQVPRRMLGKTGKTVPILLLGGGMGFDQRFDPKLAEAMRFGVDYVDAADCYAGGKCETGVAAYHQKAKNREKLWITSKSDKHDPAGFETTLAQSLSKLQTNYVDMYYLHMLEDPSFVSASLAKTVEKAKKAGKIRHFGFSCHHGNVPELLHLAAKTPWVESVMFRYNFRQYGDKELNAAIDAAAKAGVGLIAMKTQGSEAGIRDAWKKFEQTGKWNKFQSVLKAVWADERISAAVSHMDSFEKLRENIAAATDTAPLSKAEVEALDRYALATRSLACDGCDHFCGAAVPDGLRIGDTMRGVMYLDAYGDGAEARKVLGSLPVAQGRFAGVDFAAANAACPHGVDVAAHMRRAAEILTA